MPATPAWPPKSLPRLFVRMPLGEGVNVELDASHANYLGNVLRLGAGAELLLFDGSSGEWLARIAEAGKKRMTLSVGRRTREPEASPDVWLAFAPVKRAQTDWLVEKATELGAARLIPVMTRRTVAERVKLERLELISIEAAEQCGRTRLPDIVEPAALKQLLDSRDQARTLYFADEAGGEAADPDRARRRFHRRRALGNPGRAQFHRYFARAPDSPRRDCSAGGARGIYDGRRRLAPMRR
jgi:16S rRNA (uracil1498-N3)-methyltransferase